MKKIVVLFLAMLLLLCCSISAFAAETNESNLSQETLFVSKNTYTSIAKNLNAEQIKAFLGEDVTLDLQRLVPVYMPTGSSNDNSLYGMLEPTNTYNTLVYSKNGSVLGTATLEYYEGKWVVGTFYEGYNMLEEIGTLPISANQTFYYIENPYAHEQAILAVNGNTETYRSLTNPQGFIDVGSIVDDITEAKQTNSVECEGAGTGANINGVNTYIVLSFAIIAIASVLSVYIWRKKVN